MAVYPFTTTNVVVGAALVYISGIVTSTSTGAANTATATTLAPTSDATKFSIGDQINIGANTETPLIQSINTATGTLTHDIVTTPAVTVAVTQAWENLGATDGDISCDIQITIADQFVDQSIFPVTGVRSKGTAMINFPLADMKMKNVARAMGSPDVNVTTAASIDTLKLGTNENFRTDSYLVTGYGTGTLKRSWKIITASSQSAIAAKHSKDKKQITNYKVQAYFDTATQSLGTLKQGATWQYT